MAVFPYIPVEMREELVTGVNYIKTLANRFHKLHPAVVDVFGYKLAEILCHKYTGHWYPEIPMKLQAYRCIMMDPHNRDDSILKACAQSGLKYHELALPKTMTLWIDPYEVSCQLGEENYPYTVAIFDPRITRLPDLSRPSVEEQHPSSLSNRFTPTPEEDSSIWSSSLPSSPSLSDEANDSGIYVSSDRTTNPTMLSSLMEEEIWGNPAANQASTVRFRTSSPLWIPAWRAPQFYHNLSSDPQQTYWM
ncbi:maternal B9.15 protein-like [Hyla sarda]|uniref:maternal B9.15 protein-like n=1 Tax=Hyla sarda TaxID=327740 RepID=UPI0024C403E6|nr:maternal B9.15 protein-like [Hyla sarda]XP_056399368.1 maternal B9.15 protein-like [Hyla sarda]XP_056399369.1 maternal B9.15 protein-like [Hyla sarda]XP_056399370.1 maternal B9.15 protein-like [Hyla sarda]